MRCLLELDLFIRTDREGRGVGPLFRSLCRPENPVTAPGSEREDTEPVLNKSRPGATLDHLTNRVILDQP